MQTRYGARQKKRKQNLVLNSLIVIVFLGIIIVGAQLLSSPSAEKETSGTQDNDKTPAVKDDNEKEKTSEELEEETDTGDEEQVEEQDGYRFIGGGPNGPWEPIGTKQTGEHVTQFNSETLDWEEMTLALAYGAGIEHNNMTVIWLGNGGSPERAKGRVKSKDEQNQIYHVTIEWVNGEGWKPIDVQIEG